MIGHPKLWLTLFFVMPTLAGCASPTAQVDLAYHPDTAKKSSLSEVKPLTIALQIALQIDDQRHWTERGKLGIKKNIKGQVMAPVVSNRDVTAVIYAALKAELENNHYIVNSAPNGSDADFSMGVELQRYWADHLESFTRSELVGSIIANVVVVDRPGRTVFGPKTVQVTFTENRHWFLGDRAFESILNGVLVEFVNAVTRDPILLDAIRSSPKLSSSN